MRSISTEDALGVLLLVVLAPLLLLGSIFRRERTIEIVSTELARSTLAQLDEDGPTSTAVPNIHLPMSMRRAFFMTPLLYDEVMFATRQKVRRQIWHRQTGQAGPLD